MRVVILGAGVSGHTAALLLRRKLPASHEVVVVSPNRLWNWIPSNIWVGVGAMRPEQVTFELKPVYDRMRIRFLQAKGTEIHPEGDAESGPFVLVESTAEGNAGQTERLTYDYLINATGPRLDFGATPGLGPENNSLSVCSYQHAAATSRQLDAAIERLKRGERQTLLVGMGHGTCTCQGAAFEYLFNLDFALRRQGVRHLARLVFLTNEAGLGDFGVGGMFLKAGGYVIPSQTFAESLFEERGIEWITGAHVHRVDPGRVEYETLDGNRDELAFDFAMLLPPFKGVLLKAFSHDGSDLTGELFAPSGFMKVDADYTAKNFDEWEASDWPETYQTRYPNIFAIGIAFAPPHAISRPRKTPNGTPVAPAPPRTGMPSAIMGRTVAQSIADMILRGAERPTHGASMAKLGAACVASTGMSPINGTAASLTMFPIVPDHRTYPETGRSLIYTTGELGLAGHWIKHLLHVAFLYKAKALPFWWMIPE